MRKLASVQEILSIEDIENADNIQKAKVLGWNVIVKKGAYNIGDKCVFFECDSILPEKEWSEFMRPKRFRVKTCKLKGVISQGLIMPISILPNGIYNIGDDVTEIIGVKKFGVDCQLTMCDTEGSFPWYVPKTDETRLQSVINVINEMQNIECYVSLKYDGTSCTVAKKENVLSVCSRNFAKKDGNNIYWNMVRKYNLENIPDGYAIQGEIVGPKIHKNRLCLLDHDLFVFNVYDIYNSRYLDYHDFIDFCIKYGLKHVKIEYIGKFSFTLDDLLLMADGFYDNTSNCKEGIVVRPIIETYSAVLKGRLSFKVLSNDYLLKE